MLPSPCPRRVVYQRVCLPQLFPARHPSPLHRRQLLRLLRLPTLSQRRAPRVFSCFFGPGRGGAPLLLSLPLILLRGPHGFALLAQQEVAPPARADAEHGCAEGVIHRSRRGEGEEH